MKNNMNLVAGVFVCCVAGALHAADYFLEEGFSDWTSVESYRTATGEVPGSLPGTEDTVYIPDGLSRVLIDDSSVATVGRFKYLLPKTAFRDVKIEFNIRSDATFGCWLNTNSDVVTSHLLKRGAGTLRLGNVGSGSGHFKYNSNITVEEGMLVLPQNVAAYNHLWTGDVDVGANGILFLSTPGNLRCKTLSGAGIVTNDMSKSGITQLQPQNVNSLAVFSGTLAGNFNFGGIASQYLTGTASTFNGTVNISGSMYRNKPGTLGVAKLGSGAGPSSIGINQTISFVDDSGTGASGGGRLVYLGDGTGERSDKKLKFNNSGYSPLTIDAGAHGGLSMEGGWTMNQPQMIRISLDGSNTEHECVFLGSFAGSSDGDVAYTARITKKGSGIWRLGDNAERKNAGVIAVKEGVLRFDSIAERGEVCSLGLSTELYGDVSGQKPETGVSYAFFLGGGETEGTMEYTGSRPGICSSRPFAVKGKGRLLANGASVNLSGFSAADVGRHTLTLDGEGGGNVLRNVSDGDANGILEVVKKGAGTWTLAGDQTFSGGVCVDEGTLVIRKCAEGVPFKWFRLTIKETVRHSGRYEWVEHTWNKDMVRLKEFYLYDGNGKVQSSGLSYSSDRFTLAQGEAAWGYDKVPHPNAADQGLAALFDENIASPAQSMRVKLSGSSCILANPATHLPIVMRLADSTPEIASVNMRVDFAANADWSDEVPTAYSLEGSVDGVVWTVLTEDDKVELPSAAGKVYSKSRGFERPARTAAADKAFAAPLSVKLGANAALRAEYLGEVDPIKISSLLVDAAGGSCCEGFSFAANGTLDVVNVSESSESGSFVALNVSQDSGWENLKNWTVAVNGKPAGAKFNIAVLKDGLRIFKPGFVLLLQ